MLRNSPPDDCTSNARSSLGRWLFLPGALLAFACSGGVESTPANAGPAAGGADPVIPVTADPGLPVESLPAASPVGPDVPATGGGTAAPVTVQPTPGVAPVDGQPGVVQPGVQNPVVPVTPAVPGQPEAVPATELAPAGPTSGRRLTKQEFINTLSDLFGPQASAGAAFIESEGAAQSRFRNDLVELTVSGQRIADYESVAQQVATETPWASLSRFTACEDATPECRTGFVQELGRHVYRRPLTQEEAARLVVLFELDAADTFESGARFALQAMLQSPFFLYRLEKEQPQPDGYEMATRLSYFLWQSGPDTAVLDLAAAGDLATAEGVSRAAMQMFDDPRARRGVRAFADDWLRVYNNLERLSDETIGLSDEVFSAMREETLNFVVRVLMEDGAPVSALLSDQGTAFDERLAPFYGVEPQADGKYDFSAEPSRVGLLTQLAVLGSRAGPKRASIVDRGLTVAEDFLCVEVPSPPAEVAGQVAAFQEELASTASERERLAQHNLDGPACAGCHSLIDPYGLPFENYDVAGRYAQMDEFGNVLFGNGTLNIDRQQRDYANVGEFAQLLAQSPSTQRCLTQKFVQYGFGRKLEGTDQSLVDVVFERSMAAGFTYRNWVDATVGSESFRAAAPRSE